MFFKIIGFLHKQSEETRRRVGFWGALMLTLVIAGVWFSTVPARLASISENQEDTSEEVSPFAALREGVSEAVETFETQRQGILEQAEQDETEAAFGDFDALLERFEAESASSAPATTTDSSATTSSEIF